MTKPKNNETKPVVEPGGMPALRLNTMDRFYLAATKKAVGKLVFVYTLCCVWEKSRYEMVATPEIAAFDDAKKAEIYYQTVLALIEYEKKFPVYEIMFDFNSGLLEHFNQNIK